MIIFAIIILIACSYKLFYWSFRDYYYQLKYGAFMVDYELQGKDRLLYQASIKKLSQPDLINKIDSHYFIAPGYHEWMRMPTVCPYAMNFFAGGITLDTTGEGAFLTNSPDVDFTKKNPEDPPGSIAYDNDEYGDLIEKNIIAFSFNDRYLIGKKRTEMENGLPTAKSVTSYFILEFSTGKIKRFTSYKELMVEADKLDYKRHIFYLDYTKESKEAKEYKETERNKYLDKEETELFPFQLLYDRHFGMILEL